MIDGGGGGKATTDISLQAGIGYMPTPRGGLQVVPGNAKTSREQQTEIGRREWQCRAH